MVDVLGKFDLFCHQKHTATTKASTSTTNNTTFRLRFFKKKINLYKFVFLALLASLDRCASTYYMQVCKQPQATKPERKQGQFGSTGIQKLTKQKRRLVGSGFWLVVIFREFTEN